MATNTYGRSCTPNLGGVQDHYTKSEVNTLLNAKANISTVYTKSYIDGELSTLSGSIASLDANKIDQAQLDTALTTLQGTIEDGVAATYATLAGTYTKAEVDSLIDAIDLDPADYVRSVPTTTSQNTIYPGAADAIALTVRGSDTNAIVTQWLDNTSNVIGYISNSGSTTLNGALSVGSSVSTGGVAIDVNSRRITGVAAPVLGSDAVSYSTLQTYVLDFYEEITLPNQEIYSLDAGFYPDPEQTRSLYRHLRSNTLFERPSGLDIYDGEIALNFNTTSPGLFLKDTAGKIRKIGPAHVGVTPPSPINYTDLSDGEMWIDKSGATPLLRYYDESADEWVSTGIFDSELDQDHIFVGNTANAASPYSLDPGSFFVDHTAGVLEVQLADNIEFGSYGFVSESGTLLRTSVFKTTVADGETGWVELEAYDATLYRSGKYLVELRIASSNGIAVTELLVAHDGTDTYYTEYGAIGSTTSPLGEFRATIIDVAGTDTVSLQFRRTDGVSGDIVIRSVQQSVF